MAKKTGNIPGGYLNWVNSLTNVVPTGQARAKAMGIGAGFKGSFKIKKK
jgi:hypothetical protein